MAEAYEVLSDEEKRGNYDTFGMDGQGTAGVKREKKKKREKGSVFGDFVDEDEEKVCMMLSFKNHPFSESKLLLKLRLNT